MPDKPKRRKNNRNKRRNKNQNQSNSNIQIVSSTEKVEDISLSPPIASQSDVSAKTEEITSNKCSEATEENIGDDKTQKLLSGLLVSDTKEIKHDTDDLNTQKSEATEETIKITEKYKVESPEKTIKVKSKLKNNVKSKSVDNDDQPTIVEISDDGEKCEADSNLVIVDASNVLVAEVEPNIEWENTADLEELKSLKQEDTVPGALSITTIPLNVAQCELTKSMSPEEERCLRKYLQSLDLSSNQGIDPSCLEIKAEIEQMVEREIKQRLRKKGFAEDNFIPRLGPPRSLHVIDEEVSGESSATSRRHSYLNENKSDTDELDDDVFKITSDSKSKFSTNKGTKIFTNLIPQECIRVGAQIKDPEISEARGAWSTKQLESVTGAEIVYLTDSSSSTSSAYDINDIDENNEESDVSVRIITPTIEVTDTDTFLKNNFRSKSENSNEVEKMILSDNSVHEIKNDSRNNIIETKQDNSLNEIDGHEIVVLSTDVLNTDLYVKEIDNYEQQEEPNALVFKNQNHEDNSHVNNDFKENNRSDLEIKVLKCELNDAINNLIKEVISDSESVNDNSNEPLVRQDSSSSVGSSQCTAKYNPKCSSLNDIPGNESDEFSTTNNEFKHLEEIESHVKDVIETIKDNSMKGKDEAQATDLKTPSLRDLCLGTICKLPYGEQILEELANVSERLQKMSDITLEANKFRESTDKVSNKNELHKKPSPKTSVTESKIKAVPPPVQPRNSSLRISHDESQTNTKSVSIPSRVCLSPSQKMLMEKTNTFSEKEQTEHINNEHKISVDLRDKDKDSKDIINVPFKSQTGSRLLALLRPSSMTDSKENITSNNKVWNGGINKLSSLSKINVKDVNDTFTRSDDESKRPFKYDHSNSFKPIPPPKPKKFSSSFYECNQSSNFIESSLKSVKNENKYFHYSTGNLSKEIEDDISSIQNMHRHYNDIYKEARDEFYPRRPSLPKDLCDQQMEYILRKEKEVEAEIYRLENDRVKPPQRRGPRAPMILDEEAHDKSWLNSNTHNSRQLYDNTFISKSTPKMESGKLSSAFSKSEEELVRNKMYSEYVNQMAEREQRKQQKIIKITKPPHALNNSTYSKSESELKYFEHKVNNRIEKEFIDRAKERWNKLGFKDPETEDERDSDKNTYREPKVIEHKIKVIDSGEEKDVKKLPNHLQDFVNFTVKDKNDKSSSPETVMIAPTFKARSTSPAVWKPGVPPPPAGDSGASAGHPPPPPPPPVWTPNSASASPQTQRKTFRPVHFEESPPTRRKFDGRMNSTEQNGTAGLESESRLRTSQSAPATGLNLLGTSSRLPKAQNPTVTLLQKAREGQLSRAPTYQQQDRDARLPRDRPSPPSGDPVHALRRGYVSEGEGERRARDSERKMSDAQKKIDGIGPITKDGMPVALRSEVKDPSRWYKKMYDTIHKNKYDNDYVTIRYKSRRDEPQRVSSSRSQYAYFDPRSGYLSEPEGGVGRLATGTWSDAYDSDAATAPRRRTASVQEERRNDMYMSNNKYSTLASTRASQEIHKAQPGKIENYTPGKSSVVDKEAKQWLDENTPLPPYSTLLARAIQKNQNKSSTTSLPPKEKKDITSTILSKSNMARALKESGYESDSTLIFKRHEDTEAPLSPAERRAAYRDLQAGGEPPLRGFRSPAPPRTENDSAPEPPRRMQHSSISDSESPSRRYVESDVNIHYRCPVRHDPLPLVPERELARQQAEHMKQLYREQKRNKYLQENDYHDIDIQAFDASIKELQDMQNRRHQDNFMPSQKTVVPLNRYDEADRIIARALYTFNGQTARELSFRKGDIIHVRRQIDNNWYEGEIHGRVGLFPYNYVELLKGDVAQSPKKPLILEGRARAKFDFTAQTNLELPLKKGELVVLTRRIDHNWWEGRLGNKTGIFPDSYVTILQEPSQSKPEPQPILSTAKPVASPAAHGLVNGDKRSLGAHSYTPQPNSPALGNAPPATQPLLGYPTKRPQSATPGERGYSSGVDLNNTEPLYVDTNAEAIPYRAMYKYRPQNPDELELNEGDTVYVLEKCDDGWYVGSSQRTGRFGTFPGNYVERI
ncbi:uncharacterized protein LOC123693189 isoform X3 [Colias croceus]|uniref:uncharacterized protein LOC123693189 isoform X3 n=1 Tax=Colias crocea TaxID=72248 RepID=UPI001E2819EC|nr:uncharacterized protein LOC123693189 isoform X3 [Colias croceus]